MALASAIITDALREIGVISATESPSAADFQLAFTRFQHQIDAWNADRLALHVNRRELYTLTSGTSEVEIGDGSSDIDAPRPVTIRGINYVVPGTSPAVETPMGEMDDDAYMNLSIKALPNNLPTQWYYNETFPYGTLFFWPTVQQNVQIAIYYPQVLTNATAATTDMVGPPGYQEAFMYQLAIRLMTPFSVNPQQYPLLIGPDGWAATALARIKRVNTIPEQLGVDAALAPSAGGYNILNDQAAGPSTR